MSSSNRPTGHVPIIPEYKWARHSEEVADRNRSSTDGGRPGSRGLQYTGLASPPTASQPGQQSMQPETERSGRSRHRQNRSIDILDYASLRGSQSSSATPMSRSSLGNRADDAPQHQTQPTVSGGSDDINAPSDKRAESRGGRLRGFVSSLTHWPGHHHQSHTESTQSHQMSSTYPRGKDDDTTHQNARPATSHDGPNHKIYDEFTQANTRNKLPRTRSHSLDAKHTKHRDGQPQTPQPPLPPPKHAQPSSGSGSNSHQRPTSQAGVVVPNRSSSLDPQPSVTRKPTPQDSSSSAPIDAQTAKAAASAGIDLSNTTETHRHVTVAPAVTQETVVPTVREIRTERITRDIHNTHIVHRILPIKQTEHLPARHFVRNEAGGLEEVEEADVPRILGFA